jgi:hypothetical protein
MMMQIETSSFRDPSGQVFSCDGVVYRRINVCYKEEYELLKSSGLYQNLVDSGLLIPHEETAVSSPQPDIVYKVIRPEKISFISYPYEWCFSQLKAAALVTLEIQKKAVEHGMALKDASAYNIQFRRGRPVLIDTLSFRRYKEGEPWPAYRQFCQHFLGPLALMSMRDTRLGRLLRIFIDGLPLDLISSLLPLRALADFSLLLHIKMHARSQRRYSDRPEAVVKKRGKCGRLAMLGMLDNLYSAISRLKWRNQKTEWAHYYESNNYLPEAVSHKKELVSRYIDRIKPGSVWDLGANAGEFGLIASQKGIKTIAFDCDPAAIEEAYRRVVSEKDEYLLPLLIDLTNPSPGLGWQSEERDSIISRGPAEMAFALALVHHLAIANNIPFEKIADFFSRICRHLVVEFVPKTDSQVGKMLLSRRDIFTDYDQENFENKFSYYFSIERADRITSSERTLYLMRRK